MSLTMKIASRQVVFYWADDDMTASWKLTPGMDEGQIMAKIMAMMKFLQAQPADAAVIQMPLRLTRLDALDALPPPLGFDHQDEQPRVGWKPAVPVPDIAAQIAKLPSSFELIPDDEDDGA